MVLFCYFIKCTFFACIVHFLHVLEEGRWVRLEKWNRILGIICLLISILTRIQLYYQKASVRSFAGQRTDAGQMLFFLYCVVLKPLCL